MNDKRASGPVIVQAVRNFGEGEGVGGVVENLEKSFEKLGIPCERITLETTGLRRRRSSNLLVDKIFQMRDVVWFSIAGTYLIHRRQRGGGCVTITHGDPVAGDIYVNHGLLKKVMSERHPRKFSVPRNPMHWFTLFRDELRYRGHRPHKLIVSLTALDDRFMADLYPRLRAPRAVITNGIDLSRYDIATAARRDAARRNVKFSDSDFVSIFVGHEFDRKGLYPTLESMTMTGNDSKLIVVGGSERAVSQARDFADSLGISDRVHFAGRQRSPKPYLDAADCLVLATAYEAAPLVILEALASGVPVVATKTGLANDLISGEARNGVIVDRDPGAISSGTDTCAGRLSRDGRAAVSRDCRRSVEHLSWDAVAERYLNEVYKIYKTRSAQ